MPLEYQCLRCCQCLAFQAKQVTKSQKWACTKCGQKQTIQRVFAISNNAKDIRLHVQRLNMPHGDEEAQINHMLEQLEQGGYDEDDVVMEPPDAHYLAHVQEQPKLPASDWREFMQQEAGCDEEYGQHDDEEDDEDPRFVTSIKDQRQGKGASRARAVQNEHQDDAAGHTRPAKRQNSTAQVQLARGPPRTNNSTGTWKSAPAQQSGYLHPVQQQPRTHLSTQQQPAHHNTLNCPTTSFWGQPAALSQPHNTTQAHQGQQYHHHHTAGAAVSMWAVPVPAAAKTTTTTSAWPAAANKPASAPAPHLHSTGPSWCGNTAGSGPAQPSLATGGPQGVATGGSSWWEYVQECEAGCDGEKEEEGLEPGFVTAI